MAKKKRNKTLADISLSEPTKRRVASNPELSDEQRQVLKEKARRALTRREDTVRTLEGQSSSWKHLTTVQKEEIVAEWFINGGVVYGKRYTKTEIADTLGYDYAKLNKSISKLEDGFTNLCRTKEAVRNYLSSAIGKFSQQILFDRGLALRLVASFETQTEKVLKEIEDLEASLKTRPDISPAEIKIIHYKIQDRTSMLRSLNIQRVESVRVLIESSESMNRFLSLFAGGKNNGVPLHDEPKDPNTPAEREGLSRLDAIKLISENSSPILPEQRATDFAPRNPDSGFEELENGSTENQES